jgi:hypothetical protein
MKIADGEVLVYKHAKPVSVQGAHIQMLHLERKILNVATVIGKCWWGCYQAAVGTKAAERLAPYYTISGGTMFP